MRHRFAPVQEEGDVETREDAPERLVPEAVSCDFRAAISRTELGEPATAGIGWIAKTPVPFIAVGRVFAFG